MHRRQIRVGNRVIRAAVCDLCQSSPAFWPVKALEAHLLRHEVMEAGQSGQLIAVQSPTIPMTQPRARWRRGRPVGTKNRGAQAGAIVEYRRGIKAR
jgi:hypothetical protein